MYAAGKIPGGFIKRESRPSETAILAARQTDRPIRPLFPEGYKDDIQLVITVLSTDQENNPDVLGTVAASAALNLSEIPFNGPVGAVRVGRIDGEFVVNPTHSELDVETTGTDPKMSDLLEVAAVKIKGTKVVDRWSTLVDPGRPIIGNQMHGITDKDVKGAPSPKQAAEQLLKFVGDATLVGHNVGFDLGFIQEARGDGFRLSP